MVTYVPSPEAEQRGAEKRKDVKREAKKVECPDESALIPIREQWRYDLRGFLENIHPEAFSLAWSPAHLEVIAKMEHMILHGGSQAMALPRGTGKTTLATGATEWAVLYGHRKYGVVFASDQPGADNILDTIKSDIWLSPNLGKFWPKLRAYIDRGDGQAQKYRHLLNRDGSPPLIKWGTQKVVLPNTPKEEGDDWSGAIIQSKGLTGGVRGLFHAMPDGRRMRPDFGLIDDPQTKEVAKSVTQIESLESTIQGDIMGLAGAGKGFAVFMLMTVIKPNDLADRFLDSSIHPEWFAVRVPMIKKFPKEVDGLWEEYKMLRLEALTEGREPKEATEFYIANREAMDEGAEVYWEARKEDTDVSALQHAMNLRMKLGNEFLAEYQNEPIEQRGGKPYHIDEITVMQKVNSLPQLHIPSDHVHLVSFTDINYRGLNTVVVASTNDAVRKVVDYQIYPGGNQPLYDPKRYKDKSKTDAVAIANALDRHIRDIASRRYVRDGKGVSPDLVLIDCGNWMDLVFRWCETHRHYLGNGRIFPSRGMAYSKYRQTSVIGQPGDNWHVTEFKGRGRVLVHNADEWRMRAQKAFLLSSAVPGGVSLFGEKPTMHKHFADEICCEILDEYIELTEGGNQFFKWASKVGVPNDKLDALVGGFVGTSFLGASETGLGPLREPPRQKKRKKGVTRIKI